MPNRVVTMTQAPNAENLRSNFLARFNEHFLAKPEAENFELLYQHDPRLHFSALVQLAKVLKVQHENGPVGAFDAKPRPREEALRKLEERCAQAPSHCRPSAQTP